MHLCGVFHPLNEWSHGWGHGFIHSFIPYEHLYSIPAAAIVTSRPLRTPLIIYLGANARLLFPGDWRRTNYSWQWILCKDRPTGSLQTRVSSLKANRVSIFTQHSLHNLYRYHYCFLFTKTGLHLLTCSKIHTRTYVYTLYIYICAYIYTHTRIRYPTAIINPLLTVPGYRITRGVQVTNGQALADISQL